jgi:hypothetical protein
MVYFPRGPRDRTFPPTDGFIKPFPGESRDMVNEETGEVGWLVFFRLRMLKQKPRESGLDLSWSVKIALVVRSSTTEEFKYNQEKKKKENSTGQTELKRLKCPIRSMWLRCTYAPTCNSFWGRQSEGCGIIQGRGCWGSKQKNILKRIYAHRRRCYIVLKMENGSMRGITMLVGPRKPSKQETLQ